MNTGVVLIVPADEDVAYLLKEHFEAAGQSVLLVHSQAEALAAVRQSLPPAVILDSETPGLDVTDLCHNIRSTPRTRHIHITLLAPYAKRDDRLLALSSGADEFMTKPVDAEELGLRIRNALRRAEFQNLVNPTTGLPGPHLIEDRLRELLLSENEWALIRSNLRGLKTFTDAYGFLAGEEVLRFAVQVFTQTVNQLGTQTDFLGHTGSDNFIVVTALDRAEALRQVLSDRFAEGVRSHYSFREREQGYMIVRLTDGSETKAPLMALNMQMITSKQGPFHDIFELTQMQ
jgi:DNA-binding response OmpR family regulator